MGRAIAEQKITVELFDIRKFSTNKHHKVDDEPYGGGAGMLMTCQPLFDCIDHVQNLCTNTAEVIYFSAQGKRLTQKLAESYAASKSEITTSTPEIITELNEQENCSNKTETPLVNQKSKKRLILICGHYEGIDHRVIDQLVDTEICIGPFVLTGGELPAQIFIDSVARLLPNVIGKEASHQEESFSDLLDGGLEYPHYTRPSDFRGHIVPEILLSGHHAKIEAWRLEQSQIRTQQASKCRKKN